MRRPARGPRRRLDVLGAALAAVLAFTAVPAVLVAVVGNPLAGGLGPRLAACCPATRSCLLVLAAWVAWAACCAQLLRAVVAHVRSGEVGVRQGASVMDRLAARIAVRRARPHGPRRSARPHGGCRGRHPGRRAPGVRRSRAHTPRRPVAAATATYAVQPGDTLWRIADDRLGDGADWTMLAALNLGRDMGTAMRFVDPDQLRAGWHLRLPADVGATARDPPRAGPSTHAARREPGGHLPELVALGPGLARLRRARPAGRAPAPDRRRASRRSSTSTAPVRGRPGRRRPPRALRAGPGAPFLRGRQLPPRAVPARAGRRARVRAICVSPSGVTFWLGEGEPGAPPRASCA